MRIAIISQGEELLTGETVDTNSSWIADRCWGLGVSISRMVTAGDSVAEIQWALTATTAAADLVICTGGLGPTSDDLTAEAVAAWSGRALYDDSVALAQVEARYTAHGRVMNPANRKQARIPEDAELLENRWGTAPGFVVTESECTVVCFPGIPSEMHRMFDAYLVQMIERLRSDAAPCLHRIRTIGVGESQIQDRLKDVDLGAAELGFRCHLPEVQVKLRFPGGTSHEERDHAVQRVTGAIGRGVYNIDGGDLSEEVGRRLIATDATIALAESCTAGSVAAWLGAVPGASRYLMEGVVVYTNESKTRACAVAPDVIAAHGGVSEPVARQLAQEVRARSGATYGIGITGVAGPGGGSAHKPVGTVHIAVAGPDRVDHHRFNFPGQRHQVTRRAAGMALSMLLEMVGPASGQP